MRSQVLPAGLVTGLGLLLLWLAAGWLAQTQVAAQLDQQAQLQRDAIAAKQSRWQWSLNRPQQLIGHRLFGPAQAQADPQGLVLYADSDSSYQLGLHLDAPLDLVNWSRLRLHYQASKPLQLSLIGLSPQHLSCQSPRWLIPSGTMFEIATDSQHWLDSQGQQCSPDVIQALRLVLNSVPHQHWQLRQVEFLAPETLRPGPRIRLQPTLDAALAQLHTAQTAMPRLAAPRIELPSQLGASELLRWRDAIQRQVPGALIQPARPPLGFHSLRLPAPWFVLAGYALLLSWLAWRSPPAPCSEVIGCLAGPLWLVLGLHFGGRGIEPSHFAALFGLSFALYLGFKRPQLDWQLLGPGGYQRWAPWLLLPLVALLALASHAQWQPPSLAHIVSYLVWASLQQWLLLIIIWPRLRQRLPPASADLLAAGLFMLMHMPNAELMQLCLLAEWYWLRCFQRQRGLLPIATAHAAAALCLQASLGPNSLLRCLEVSARFLR